MLAAIVSQNYRLLVLMGYRKIIARYVAKWVIAQMCLCETKKPTGCIAPCWGADDLPEKVSRNMGYRSDSIAISRDMGPLIFRCHNPWAFFSRFGSETPELYRNLP